MKPQETLILTRYVKACCPQQAIDEYTPDAWHDLLSDLALADCREAVAIVAKRQPFVSPSEIRAEVRRIREARIARSVIPAPSRELTDDPAAYRRALATSIRQAADGQGEPAEARLAITGGPARPTAREGRPPATLRSALAEFRAALGPARRRRPSSDPQQIARQQAAKARERREAQEAREPQEGREAS